MTYLFTFGVGSPLAKYYLEVVAADETAARCKVFMLFSKHWASCYPGTKRDTLEGVWGLTRLEVHWDASLRLGTNFDDVPDDIAEQALSAWGVNRS